MNLRYTVGDLTVFMLAPIALRRRGTVVFAYGGAKEKGFCHAVQPFAERLAHLGFAVCYFDYRSNIEGNEFSDFGMFDRVEDLKTVIGFVQKTQRPPFYLVGLSMGGQIAVEAAADERYRSLFKTVVLIAPAAYAREATKEGVHFGAEFKNVITQTNSWKSSSAFDAVSRLRSNLVVFSFRDDEVVPSEISEAYCEAFAKQNRPMHALVFPGGHNGNLTDPERIDLVSHWIDRLIESQSR